MGYTPKISEALHGMDRAKHHIRNPHDLKTHYEKATQVGQLVMVDNEQSELGLIVVADGRQIRVALDTAAQVSLSKLILENVHRTLDELVRSDS